MAHYFDYSKFFSSVLIIIFYSKANKKNLTLQFILIDTWKFLKLLLNARWGNKFECSETIGFLETFLIRTIWFLLGYAIFHEIEQNMQRMYKFRPLVVDNRAK